VIQKLLVDGIAKQILNGTVTDGDVIHVGFDGENLTIGKPTVN